MNIDKNNIDELFFMDKKLQQEFPSFKPQIDQWVLGRQIPALRFLSQKSQLELLEKLNTSDNLAILERYFKEKVSIQTIDYHIARHHKIDLNDLETFLLEMSGFSNNFSISRDADYAYISFWR